MALALKILIVSAAALSVRAEMSERSSFISALAPREMYSGVQLALECFATEATDARGERVVDPTTAVAVDYVNVTPYCRAYRQFIAQIRHDPGLPSRFRCRGC